MGVMSQFKIPYAGTKIFHVEATVFGAILFGFMDNLPG